jgi:hypothetical protein
VNATDGVFNGIINARDGVFSGTVNANNGSFRGTISAGLLYASFEDTTAKKYYDFAANTEIYTVWNTLGLSVSSFKADGSYGSKTGIQELAFMYLLQK